MTKNMDFLSDFGVQPIFLAAQVVNFLVLLFILKKLLYGPILKVLSQRRKRIEDSLKNAEEIERKLAETEEQAEKNIAKTLQESQKILDETNTAAKQILDEANKAAEGILLKAADNAGKIVEREKELLMQEVRGNVAGLVALVFEKVTGKKIIERNQKEIIEKEVKNLS